MINFLRIVSNIRLGDYLHQDGTIDSIPSKDIIGVCVVPSNFLPDKYARIISLTQGGFCPWGMNIRLKSEYKKRLPRRKGRAFNWGHVNGYFGDPLTDPYLSDNSFNSKFLRDLPGGNAFQDYKGYENMKLYKEKYGDNETSPNAFTGVIKESPSYRKNDWYLPAIGELVFLPTRINLIKDKINRALIAGSSGVILPLNFFWSSTESDPGEAWEVNLHSFTVDSCGKRIGDYTRAFLAL